MAALKRLKRTCVYQTVRLVVWIFNIMPRTLGMYVSSWLGLVTWRGLLRDRYRINRHLGLAYGNRYTTAERTMIGRTFFINSARNIVDLARLRKHYRDEIEPIISVEGLDHLKRAYNRGRGMIGVTGHLGNFEMLAAYVAGLGYPTAVIGRELYDSRLDRLVVGNRSAAGVTNISTTASPREVIKWLRGGGILGVLIDTDSFRVRGRFIPSFGRLAFTPIGQSILALRTGAAVVPLAFLRTADNRYRLVIKPEVHVEPSDDRDQAAYELTLKCTRELERIIDEDPAQWIWLANRWRTKAPLSA